MLKKDCADHAIKAVLFSSIFVNIMDISTAIFSVFAVVLLLALVVIVRSVYVLKRRGNNVALDKRKSVKVMVVAGSGSSSRSNIKNSSIWIAKQTRLWSNQRKCLLSLS